MGFFISKDFYQLNLNIFKEQMAYIQNLIDIVNSITSYQQQHQISSYYHPFLNHQQYPNVFPTQVLKSYSRITTKRFFPKFILNIKVPIFKTSLSSPLNSQQTPVRAMEFVKKEKTCTLKKRLNTTIKSNKKLIKTKISLNRHQKNFGLNISNLRPSIFQSASAKRRTGTILNGNINEIDKDIKTKVDEHFKRSLGNDYLNYLDVNSSY